jgi:hypothetical protein
MVTLCNTHNIYGIPQHSMVTLSNVLVPLVTFVCYAYAICVDYSVVK